MTADLNVRAKTLQQVSEFKALAEALGIEIIVTCCDELAHPSQDQGSDKATVRVFTRRDLHGRTVNALKTQTNQFRRRNAILAVPLGATSATNWAAEDPRVDLLTVTNLDRKAQLKRSTARFAASSDTALEIPIRPLIRTVGLDRSRYLKAYRETIETALTAEMQVVLSSSAADAYELRSPAGLCYIGTVLGLDRKYVKDSLEWAKRRVLRNVDRFRPEFIAPGVEIVRGRPSDEDV